MSKKNETKRPELPSDIVYEQKSKLIEWMMGSGLSPMPHLHKEIELIYVRQGRSAAFADRTRYVLDAGDLFIAFPNQIHYYDTYESGKYEIGIFSPDIIFGLGDKIRGSIPTVNTVHLAPDDPIRKYLDDASAARVEDGPYSLTIVSGCLNLLICALLPRLKLRPLSTSDNSALRDILDYCSRNYGGALTLAATAEELHLSKYYVSHLLNQKLNLSFSDYVNSLRVDAACTLLNHTDKKIADISEDVGFGTIRSFNRAFQRLMNRTPGEYREAAQSDQSRFR